MHDDVPAWQNTGSHERSLLHFLSSTPVRHPRCRSSAASAIFPCICPAFPPRTDIVSAEIQEGQTRDTTLVCSVQGAHTRAQTQQVGLRAIQALCPSRWRSYGVCQEDYNRCNFHETGAKQHFSSWKDFVGLLAQKTHRAPQAMDRTVFHARMHCSRERGSCCHHP
jgi:hypothetical protein